MVPTIKEVKKSLLLKGWVLKTSENDFTLVYLPLHIAGRTIVKFLEKFKLAMLQDIKQIIT
jgi:hypothetical protein